MIIEKIKTNQGTIYNINLSDQSNMDYLNSLGIDLLSVVQNEIQKQLQKLEKERLQKVLTEQGYISLADVQLYASQNDTEAQAILDWYSNNNGNGYDDLIWDWIDNTLPTYTTVDELLSLNLKQIEEDIYQQALNNNPLP